ncbi:hypothetical protein Leryth_019016 [Lithospermum erythrorhizon]|nr:hypothetical protein Leryth_019016 [Lithospermum erythrorhizon]
MASAIAASLNLGFTSSRHTTWNWCSRNQLRGVGAAAEAGILTKTPTPGLHLKMQQHDASNHAVIQSKKGNPPVMPAVITPGGPLDLSTVLFRNRIIFIGQPINSQVAQRVISQLVTLATIDQDADILVYLNCPGGSTYSVLAIYDCMSWVGFKASFQYFSNIFLFI